jgi:predicted nucleic acid-binding protein
LIAALVDSCVWIALEKAELTSANLGSVLDMPLRSNPTILSELKFGVEITNNPIVRQSRQAMLDKVTRYEMLPVNYEVAMQFGMLNAHLRLLGKTRQRVQDLWIASTAIVHDVSLNGHDFEDIPNLKLVVV